MEFWKDILVRTRPPAGGRRLTAGLTFLVCAILLLFSPPIAPALSFSMRSGAGMGRAPLSMAVERNAAPTRPDHLGRSGGNGSEFGDAAPERTAWVQRGHLEDRALTPARYFGVTAAILGGAGIVLFVTWTAIEWWERR